MKPSKYNILFAYKGKTLAFNSLSTGFAEVNNDFLRILNNIKNMDISQLNKQDEILLENMRKGNFIIDDDYDELNMIKFNSYFGKFSNKHFDLTIAPTLQCNFDCPYCYEERKLGIMSSDVMNAICNTIKYEAANKHSISVTWYGGEPLLVKNLIFDMSQKIIDICNEENVKYNSVIITNGYLINDDIADNFKRLQIRGAQITIDGPPNIHNSRRKLRGKTTKGSFDIIIKNIKKLMKKDIAVNIRVNIDKNNMLTIEELSDILVQNGLQACNISFGYVKNYTSACDCSITDNLTNEQYAQKILIYQKLFLNHGFKVLDYPYYPGIKANYCCADSINSFVIDYNGEMYKCLNDIGDKKRSVGNIKNPITHYDNLNIRYLMWFIFLKPIHVRLFIILHELALRIYEISPQI